MKLLMDQPLLPGLHQLRPYHLLEPVLKMEPVRALLFVLRNKLLMNLIKF